jgi:ABC transport system ATP-binding/permease protein
MRYLCALQPSEKFQLLQFIMSAIQVEKLSMQFGEFQMFSQASFSVEREERAALVARNGAGKTTLFNIITGRESAGGGTVWKDPNLKIAHLLQDEQFSAGISVIEELFASPEPAFKAAKEYDMAILSEDSLRIDKAIAEMERLEAWEIEHLAKQVLEKLKLTDFSQDVSTLSGGQKKRLSLAKVLVQRPDFLLLDEPTNHLDIDMIAWLEGYLKSSQTGMLVITHDRYFIDRVCTSIIELERAQFRKFSGNYSYFLEKKQELEEAQEGQVEKAKSLYRKELQWIRRQPKARSTKAKYRVDAFEQVKELAFSGQKKDEIKFEFTGNRLGNKIAEAKDLSKSYDDKHLFSGFSYNFQKGEKIALIGENGSGKSTFIKIMLGQVAPIQAA